MSSAEIANIVCYKDEVNDEEIMNEGIVFERRCIEKLQQLGFVNVQATPITDYGADIIAYNDGIKCIFQCKYCKQKQGVSAVQEILTAKHFYQAHKCAVISRSGYTRQAYNLAKPNFILLITETELFSARSIDSLFADGIELLNAAKPIVYDYDIITEFNAIKHSLGRTPTWPELDKSLRYRINKQYKNYSTFLISIGERFKNSRSTDKQLKTEYIRIRELLGRVPRAVDIKDNTHLPYNSFHQYPLSKLQKECGDIPVCDRSVTKDDLIQEYLELKNQLGHFPSGKEIDKLGKHKTHQYRRKFGSLEQFFSLPQINKPRKHIMTALEIEVVYILLDLCFELQDDEMSYQALKDLSQGCKKLLTTNQIEHKFGNYSKFIERINTKETFVILRKQLKGLIQKYITEL